MSSKRKKSRMASVAPKWTHAFSISSVNLEKDKK